MSDMHFLAVNKRGFASLYALVILQILTIYCVLLISSATSIAQTLHAEDSLHHAQLASIYRIKARLQQKPFPKEETEEEEGTAETMPPPQTTFPLSEESMQIEGYTITLTYEEDSAYVQMEGLSFIVRVDPVQKTILDLVYEEGNLPS